MRAGFMIIGFIAGLVMAVVGDDSYGLAAVILGTLAGFCLSESAALRSRLRRLELQLPDKQQAARTAVQTSVTQSQSQSQSQSKPETAQEPPSQATETASKPAMVTEPKPTVAAKTAPTTTKTVTSQAHAPAGLTYDQEPGQFEKTIRAAIRWLLSGNVPVKLGVLVSFFGVAFFLKYAADQGWLSVPVEVKLLGVAAFGVGLLVFGWRLRDKFRVYALSVQGGGIGILFLTVFTAFAQFHVLPPTVAFVFLLVLAVAASLLAWRQQAQALAALGCLGGFLAPLLVSTGSGNYIVLFTYYTVLNLAVFGLSWVTRWRWLNLIGFVFTFGIGAAWGVSDYNASMFATTEVFLIVNFLFYTTISVLYGLSAPPNFKRVVDSTLVFGTPLVCFPMQAGLLEGDQDQLAWSAFLVALLYAAIAGFIHHRSKQRLLFESFVALAIAFITLAIPLALSAQWTSASWLLEGVALIWIGVRQERRLPPIAGFTMLIAGTLAYSLNMSLESADWVLLNNELLGGLLVAGTAYTAAVLLWRSCAAHEQILGVLLYAWGALWLLAIGCFQIEAFASHAYYLISFVLCLALIQGLHLLLARYYGLLFANSWYAYLPLLGILALQRVEASGLPISLYGWFIWPFALFIHNWGLQFPLAGSGYRKILRGAGLWLIALLLATQASVYLGDIVGAAPVWYVIAAMLVLAAASEAGYRLADYTQESAWRLLGSWPLMGVLVFWVLGANLFMAATPDPLPFIPVLNPLFLMTALTGFLVWRGVDRAQWVRIMESNKQLAAGALAGIGLYLLTCMLARVVHHWGGVPFNVDSMSESILFQSALSITWALAGLSGMVLGALKKQRLLWFVSAGLMGVVVLKLFTIDLGNSGSVERIVSFIGVGLLLLVVGYIAPAPKVHIDNSKG